MFKTGQKVVCINDEFEPWVYDLYRNLPKKDKTYIVRAIGVGRSDPKFVLDEDINLKMASAEFNIIIYLNELKNPDDPHSSQKQELGFKSDRFAPLVSDEDEVEDAYVIPYSDKHSTRERELVEK